MQKHVPILIIAAATCLLAGCQHRDAILFATNTNLGVKVGFNPQQIPEINVGYARQEGALVPLYLAPNDAMKSVQLSATDQALVTAAQAQIEATRAISDADWIAKGKPPLDVAIALLDLTVKSTTAPNGPKQNSTSAAKTHSPLVVSLQNAIKALKESKENERKSAFADVDAWFIATTSLNSATGNFVDSKKYIAKSEDAKGKREDAYSVLATFSGSGFFENGSSTEIVATNPGGYKASGKINQIFATGLAAQKLADHGSTLTTPQVVNLSEITAKAQEEGAEKERALQRLTEAISQSDKTGKEREKMVAGYLSGAVKTDSERGEDLIEKISTERSRDEIRKLLSDLTLTELKDAAGKAPAAK